MKKVFLLITLLFGMICCEYKVIMCPILDDDAQKWVVGNFIANQCNCHSDENCVHQCMKDALEIYSLNNKLTKYFVTIKRYTNFDGSLQLLCNYRDEIVLCSGNLRSGQIQACKDAGWGG